MIHYIDNIEFTLSGWVGFYSILCTVFVTLVGLYLGGSVVIDWLTDRFERK